jgi:hypothetical protein
MTTAIMIESAATSSHDHDSLNGLEPARIEEAAAGLAADPATALTTFRARTMWQGRLRSRTDIESYDLAGKCIPRRHRIVSDEPLELLGTNEAPNPQDLARQNVIPNCTPMGHPTRSTSALRAFKW